MMHHVWRAITIFSEPEEKMLIVENRFLAQTPKEMSVEEGDVLYLIEQSNR